MKKSGDIMEYLILESMKKSWKYMKTVSSILLKELITASTKKTCGILETTMKKLGLTKKRSYKNIYKQNGEE